jgi:hypothetical protein
VAFKTGTVSVPANGSVLVYSSSTCIPAAVVLQNLSSGQLGLWDGDTAHASAPATFPVTLDNFVGQLYLQNNTSNAQTVAYYASDVT